MKILFRNRYSLLIPFFVLLLFACRSKPTGTPNELRLSDDHHIMVLDSAAASQVIITDTTDGFFDHIGKLDMEIQMKTSFPAQTSRAQVLDEYKKALQAEVMDFSSEEKRYLQEIWKEVFEKVSLVNPDLFPPNIQLIKLDTRHYGPGVYYTRENAILIPEEALDPADKTQFIQVMLHELFHVYSRFNPEMRTRLYEIIGFSALGDLSVLQMPDSLRQRILLNPDGVNFAQVIRLGGTDADPVFAIPVITANSFEFKEERPVFFSYLQFNLYRIKPPRTRLAQVYANPDGSPTLQLMQQNRFFEQIGDNTDYIIHPDEILADNFVLLVNGDLQDKNTGDLSARGQEIQRAMKKLLSNEN